METMKRSWVDLGGEVVELHSRRKAFQSDAEVTKLPS